MPTLLLLLSACGLTPFIFDTGTDDTDTDDTGDEDTSDTDVVDLPGFAVLSLNLHCLETDGTSFSDNPSRFAAIADTVATEDVAALALQEACTSTSEDATEMLRLALESRTGESWSAEWLATHTAWAGTPDEAEEGVAVLARGALSSPTEVHYHAQTDLIRAGLAATLPAELGGLALHTIHLSVMDADVRAAQARHTAVAALVDADPLLDVLVMGDLNDTEGSATHAAFGDMGFEDLTAALDAGRIDHAMLHRGAAWRASEARLIFDGADHPLISDHPGVLVRLEPDTDEAVPRTRIDVYGDVGWGHHMTVRGDTAPLSWEQGLPAIALTSDHWRLVLTELPAAPFEYKALIDDQTWQQGDNAQGTGGTDNQVTPGF